MISIATTFFNTEKEYLENLYNSIINQTYTNWEWVVTDDYSRDAYYTDLVKSLPQRDKRIRYVEQKFKKEIFWNPHKYAKGDIVAQVDSDDYLVPKSLEVLNYFYNKYPDVVVITTELNNYRYGQYCGSLYLNFENHRSVNDFMHGIKNDKTIERQCSSDVFIVGYLRSWRNMNIDFNENNKYDVKHIVNDYVQLTRVEEYGKYLHIPRSLYMYNTRNDSISRKIDEFNSFGSATGPINDEIFERRKDKEINSIKRIFESIFHESTAFHNHHIIHDKTSKKISFITENTLKLIQIDALRELFFDHDIYFNDHNIDVDYTIILLTYNNQFEYFKEFLNKVNKKSRISVQITHKDYKPDNDLYVKVLEHLRNLGYGFSHSEYNNQYMTINL